MLRIIDDAAQDHAALAIAAGPEAVVLDRPGKYCFSRGLMTAAMLLRSVGEDTKMTAESFENFRARSLETGADEVVERRWEPGQIVETHTHPFDAEAVVIEGEMWLTYSGETRHLRVGDKFQIHAGTPHAERYGPHGAVYRVARRSPR
jgi:quercetin dioxygenase-like cupin family protein